MSEGGDTLTPMDVLFPHQGNPPAPMLKDIRGSAKRAINFAWYQVGELGMDGTSGRIYIEVTGTASAGRDEFRSSPLSCDVIGSTTDDVFGEYEEPDFRGEVEYLLDLYGLPADPTSWTTIEPGAIERISIRRE